MSGTGAGGAPRRGRGGGRPRLLLLTTDYPPARGGIQTLSSRLAEGLSAFETHVLAPNGAGARAYDAAHPLAIRRSPAPATLGVARNAVLGGLSLAEGLRLRPALILSMHVLTAPPAALLAATTGSRTVQYFHAQEIPHRPRLAAFAAERAHANVAVSGYTAGLLEALGVASARISRIPPGVELPADATPLPAARPTVLTVARLVDRYKGHDVLARALVEVRRAVPDVEWIVIGEGPLREELEHLTKALGIADSVRFLGAVNDAERDEWLRRASVFAMPSRLPGPGRGGEGFGIAFLEAAAYGRPVLAGNVGGALDAVADGETGLLVDPEDPAAVAGALVRLLGDPGLAAEMGAAGARRARGFSWPAIIARVEELLLATLAGRGAPAPDEPPPARTAA